MTRKLDSGRLWFIFNEGSEDVTETLKLSGGKNIYLLDQTFGTVKKLELAECTLSCGDIAVYLVTDEEYEDTTDKGYTEITLGDARIVGYDKFIIEYEGVKSLSYDGEPMIDEDFSGTVSYEVDYTLPDDASADDLYRISFEDTSVTVGVYKDGECLADCGLLPMVGYINGEKLVGGGTLTVKVSNTAANEILNKLDVILSHPKGELGAYNPKMTVFESRRPRLKLGKIKLERVNGK